MKVHLTKEGKERLQNELQKLTSEDRPAIIKAIAEARAHGDLSENAEYHSAKERQGFIETRIRELEGVLASPQIIDPAKVGANGKCIFGAFVDVVVGGKKQTYRIVSEYEADIDSGLLSMTSPLGRALIGKTAGDVDYFKPGAKDDDEVDEDTPGAIKYEVAAVRYK